MSEQFKPFNQMTPDDYAAIGFKCGLEVHQQLKTGHKLFCRCPAPEGENGARYSAAYDAEVLRHMRPTLSELGEYDGTALMEKKTRKNIYYRIHHDTVCTYEFDDTPPFFPDDYAIDIALEISLLLNLNIVGEMHIARKQYLDGSIPTGFQRTAILGVGGWIPYKDRRISIRQLSLEEDSCREVSDVGHERVLLTDRLGMPLIETVTEPDMRTPQEAAEVCQIIRMLYRSTGKVRTGYGAAREDVNVSVAGGTRCEIKGVPQITRIPRLVYNEARRQWSLLRIRDLLHERGVRPGLFQWTRQDVTHTVAHSSYEPLRFALSEGSRVKCVRLCGFAELLNETTQENTHFAQEFADRIRVIACLTHKPCMIHSDMASETLQGRDWKAVRRRMRAEPGDALILVWGNDEDTNTACQEIANRAREAVAGVPSDTRQALKDGTNGFERVLPGAERMYPDTDLPLLRIDRSRLDRIRAGLPERVWERESRYRALGLPTDVILPLCISRRAALFDRITGPLAVDATFAAVVLIQRFKHLRRSGVAVDRLADDEIYEVFQAYQKGRIPREAVCDVLRRLAEHPARAETAEARATAVLAELGLAPLSDDELGRAVRESLDRPDDGRFTTRARKLQWTIGEIKRGFPGRVDGKRLAAWMNNHPEAPAASESRAATVGER